MSNLMKTGNVLDLRTAGGIFSTCIFQAASSAVAAGVTTTAFQDDLNSSTSSGITQNRSTSNCFGGRVPQGEIWTIWGIQVQLDIETTALISKADSAILTQDALNRISVSMNLRGQEIQVGSIKCFPSGLGANTITMNGGRAVNVMRFPRTQPLQLESNDVFTVTYKMETAYTSGAATDALRIFTYCQGSKAISLANLAGA